mmetsp:Transcript_2018/g.6694  ORF Transcript_2018/g.6694 Transcript_2018/m.6694 type:complete len:318 (+) Transcript_2018:1566-2519(+)
MTPPAGPGRASKPPGLDEAMMFFPTRPCRVGFGSGRRLGVFFIAVFLLPVVACEELASFARSQVLRRALPKVPKGSTPLLPTVECPSEDLDLCLKGLTSLWRFSDDDDLWSYSYSYEVAVPPMEELCELASARFRTRDAPCGDSLERALDATVLSSCAPELYDLLDCLLEATCPFLDGGFLDCEDPPPVSGDNSTATNATEDEQHHHHHHKDDDDDDQKRRHPRGKSPVWIVFIAVFSAAAGAALLYVLFLFRDFLGVSSTLQFRVVGDTELTAVIENGGDGAAKFVPLVDQDNDDDGRSPGTGAAAAAAAVDHDDP